MDDENAKSATGRMRPQNRGIETVEIVIELPNG
jgi:hypothetical protein